MAAREEISLETIPRDLEGLGPPQQYPPWYKTIFTGVTALQTVECKLNQLSHPQHKMVRRTAELDLSSTQLQAATTHDFNTVPAAAAKREFISAVTNSDVDSMIFSWLCVWYTAYLESRIRESWSALFRPVLVGINLETESPTEADLAIAFIFMKAVVSNYKASDLTLMGICDELDNYNKGLPKGDNKGLLNEDNNDVHRIAPAQLVFSIVGWTSFLYSPRSEPDPEYLRIINPSSVSSAPTTFSRRPSQRNKSKTFKSFQQELDFKDQPLFLLLKGFGKVIPKHHREHTAGYEPSGVIPKPDGWIEVSLLCFRTLNKFASIEIDWVENLALHLEFDSSKKRLKLFQFPSACLILSYNSDSSVLAQLLLDFAGSTDFPRTEEAIEYFKEVLLSYRLIFGQDKSSYQAFNKQLQKWHECLNGTAISRKTPDPLLPKICGSSWNSDGVKDIWDEIGADYPAPRYNPNIDFPFLGKRLLELQIYVRAQHPNSIKALWNDRRNLSWWWTFWAVIIIGGATLVLGLLQVALQILQVVVSQDGGSQVHSGLR